LKAKIHRLLFLSGLRIGSHPPAPYLTQENLIPKLLMKTDIP
jgi:hypothetical protein